MFSPQRQREIAQRMYLQECRIFAELHREHDAAAIAAVAREPAAATVLSTPFAVEPEEASPRCC